MLGLVEKQVHFCNKPDRTDSFLSVKYIIFVEFIKIITTECRLFKLTFMRTKTLFSEILQGGLPVRVGYRTEAMSTGSHT